MADSGLETRDSEVFGRHDLLRDRPDYAGSRRIKIRAGFETWLA
jgi:hypothetical protein